MVFDKESAEALNKAFTEQMGTEEGQAAITKKGLSFIKDILKKESMARVVMPPSGMLYFPLCNTAYAMGELRTIAERTKECALCLTCKNHLLRLGRGKCWELDYERKD